MIFFPKGKNVELLLGKQKINKDTKYRLINFCVVIDLENEKLLYNNLTKELLVLDRSEFYLLDMEIYDSSLDYLIENWFLVPQNNNDRKLCDQLRQGEKMFRKFLGYSKYTVFPTMDCNARCFYCFEHGAKRYSMSDETAIKVAKFIENSHYGNDFEILWFGGEPLFNSKAIDIICNYLISKKINFKSTMITNGYLFSEEMVLKAKNIWNIKSVQITLDGTEQVYNKCKAYIYKDDTSPFKTVIKNIECLLLNDVLVDIRLNMSHHNIDDLYCLVDELSDNFKWSKNLYVYAWLLYDNRGEIKNIKSKDEKAYLTQNLIKLERHIEDLGLKRATFPSSKIKVDKCSADNDFCVTVLPNGNLGCCDHHSEDEIIGNIESDFINKEIAESWKKTNNVLPLCDTCTLYPTCIKLVKCPDDYFECDIYDQEFKLNKLKREITNLYRKLLEKRCSEL